MSLRPDCQTPLLGFSQEKGSGMYHYDRMTRDGKVISRNGSFIMEHTADQCDYEGCRRTRATGRFCFDHYRR